MNPLPPQAYTKDTLLKAYAWLMTQGPSIKEMATTPDILVSLYLKATRDGDSALDRPSIQNFKSELKNLAGLMGQLDNKTAATPASASAASQQTQPAAAPQAYQHQAPRPQQVPMPSAPVFAASQGFLGASELDTASQAMIREVKNDFNLSSETEALRMLIKIGYSRCKTIL